MKVLHLISGGDSGGAKTHLFSLLDKLKDKAYVRVACLIDGVFFQELQEKDIDNVLFRQKNRFDLSVVNEIVKMINEEKFDVFHVHGARANFVAEFVMNKIDIPTVTTVHSDYLLDFDEPIKKILFTNLNKRALKKIKYHIAVSDNFKDMLIERGFKPNNIHTVYNGMDFSCVPDDITPKEEYAKKHGFEYDENITYVGIAARFDIVKGVDVFIKAAGEVLKDHNNIEFLIAGDGAEKEKLLKLAQSTGFSEKIRFLGYESDIYGFWNIIDINCLTSLCESFPYSMLEGAALGKPMIASRVGGIPSLVVDDETGYLFESGEYEELAKKISFLAENPGIISSLGENIKKRATSLFSNETFANTHIDIYKKIINDYKSDKEYDFAVSGYYGFRNNGDDALLLALVEDIKKEKNDARVVVFSNRPKETKQIYRIDAVHRLDMFKLSKVLKKTKVLLFGGGSLLQDETSSKSLWYYLSVIKLAKKNSTKVMQFANGFGPVNRKYNKKLTASIINECVDVITMRERASLDRMKMIGVNKDIELTADPAMLLEGVSDNKVSKLFSYIGIPAKNYITVAVREWKNNSSDFNDEVAKALKCFSEENDLNVLFIPMQKPHDLDISYDIKDKIGDRAYVIDCDISIRETIGIIRNSKLNVAMRLHSIIYSVAQGVRTVALRYDPKIDGFMDYVGLDCICNVETVSTEELYDKLQKSYNFEMNDKHNELTQKAKINTIKALEMLK